MKTADLLESRAAAYARMTAADVADDEPGFIAARNELRSIDAQLDRTSELNDAERREAGRPLTGTQTPEFRTYSLATRIRHELDPSIDAGREIEMEQEMARRSNQKGGGIRVPLEYFEKRATQTTANSATISPVDFRPELFTTALMNATVMQALGATILPGLSGNVVIPRETGSPNVGWVNEDEALPTGNASFDSFTLTPHHVGAITEISRQLIMQASPAADAVLRLMLSRNIGLEIDRAAINGSGVGAVPLGILNDPAIPTEAYATDLFTTSANMIAKADLANVGGSRAFLSTNGVKANAAKTKTTDGMPVGVSTIFHGESVQFSNQVPSNLNPSANKHGLVYGDFSDFYIGVWDQISILLNPYSESAYSKGNILLRAMASVDFGVRRPASFVKATGVTVS